MIVVSNTSPLTNLAAINQFHLLHKLYKEIHISAAVWDELNAFGRSWPGQREVAKAGWVIHHPIENESLVLALENELDRGEAATIALALSVQADFVLLDEKMGRQIGRRMDLKVIGILGILLEAKAKQHISLIQPHLQNLRQKAGFYISQSLYQKVLELTNEA